MLVPPEPERTTDVAGVVGDMLVARDKGGPKLGKGLTIRKMIEEGRR
jgi:hypothetical protein